MESDPKAPWPIKLHKENKSNNKDKPVTVYATKAYGETRGIAPLIPYLRTDWRRVVFTLLKGTLPNITLRLRNETKADSQQNARKSTPKFICWK